MKVLFSVKILHVKTKKCVLKRIKHKNSLTAENFKLTCSKKERFGINWPVLCRDPKLLCLFFFTVMYPAYAKWVQSHRDLPIKLNQWCNVVVCLYTISE